MLAAGCVLGPRHCGSTAQKRTTVGIDTTGFRGFGTRGGIARLVALIGRRRWDVFRDRHIGLRRRGDGIWISCIGRWGTHDGTLAGYAHIPRRTWIVHIKTIVWRGRCGVGLRRGHLANLVFAHKSSGAWLLGVAVRVGGIGRCNRINDGGIRACEHQEQPGDSVPSFLCRPHHGCNHIKDRGGEASPRWDPSRLDEEILRTTWVFGGRHVG